MPAAERVTVDHVKADPRVAGYIAGANRHLAAIGFTEHGERHCGLCRGSRSTCCAPRL